MAESLDQAMTRKGLSNAACARLVSAGWRATAPRSISRIRQGYDASVELAERLADVVNAYAPPDRSWLRGGTVRPIDMVSQRNRIVLRQRDPHRSMARAPLADSTGGGGDDGAIEGERVA